MIMVAIPLTMIGVMPGFAILNLLFASSVKGYANPIYFTATVMIGAEPGWAVPPWAKS